MFSWNTWKFSKRTSQLLNIPRYILVLDGPSTGSICIEFHLPAHLKFQVFPLSEKQIECLKMIRFGDVIIEAVICENFQYNIRGGKHHIIIVDSTCTYMVWEVDRVGL